MKNCSMSMLLEALVDFSVVMMLIKLVSGLLDRLTLNSDMEETVDNKALSIPTECR